MGTPVGIMLGDHVTGVVAQGTSGELGVGRSRAHPDGVMTAVLDALRLAGVELTQVTSLVLCTGPDPGGASRLTEARSHLRSAGVGVRPRLSQGGTEEMAGWTAARALSRFKGLHPAALLHVGENGVAAAYLGRPLVARREPLTVSPQLVLGAHQALGHFDGPPPARWPGGAEARRIVAATMAQAERLVGSVVSSTRRSPARMTLVVTGVLGPLYGSLLAQRMGIGQVMVPPHCDIFPAFGCFLQAVGKVSRVSWPQHLIQEPVGRDPWRNLKEYRLAYLLGSEASLSLPVYIRGLLNPGFTIAGPAVIEGSSGVVLVAPGHEAQLDAGRNLMLGDGR